MATPASILLTITPSSPQLSKSGFHEFSLTLSATTNSNQSIIADLIFPLLHPATDVYTHQGLTFTVISSGNPVKRPNVCVQAIPSPTDSNGRAVIPARGSAEPFSITHGIKFQNLEPMQKRAGEDDAAAERRCWMMASFDPVGAFDVGRKYEVGLERTWSAIHWWRVVDGEVGERIVAALFGKREVVRTELPMVMVGKAAFEVVE